ncbi:hypothetical protein MVEG_10689 [Podila verticillata NRRL 6337]|nr:hypothetical protein MVEG_10689 [Podila verticillata NRRL 6337]
MPTKTHTKRQPGTDPENVEDPGFERGMTREHDPRGDSTTATSEYVRTTSKFLKSELYGSFKSSFTLSLSGGIEGLKLGITNNVCVGASCTRSTEARETFIIQGKTGDAVVAEIALGMGLCLKPSVPYASSSRRRAIA